MQVGLCLHAQSMGPAAASAVDELSLQSAVRQAETRAATLLKHVSIAPG